MAVAHGFGQRERDPGAHPDHRGLVDAESFRDQIGGTEADTPDVASQPVGILAHDLHGIGAVGLEDAHRAGRADAVLVEEHHDLADPLLVRPGRGDPVGPLRTDPLDLAQTRRIGLDDVEHVRAEQPHHAPGISRTDTPDHAGAEIFFDAFDRRGGGDLQETRAELQPMGPVVGPFARGGVPFAGRNRRRMAHHSDETAVATGLDAQYAEAGLGVVEGDPLDEAGQHLEARGGGRTHWRPMPDMGLGAIHAGVIACHGPARRAVAGPVREDRMREPRSVSCRVKSGAGCPGLNHRAIDGGSVRPLRQHEEYPAAATAEAGCPRASKVGDGLAKTLKERTRFARRGAPNDQACDTRQAIVHDYTAT